MRNPINTERIQDYARYLPAGGAALCALLTGVTAGYVLGRRHARREFDARLDAEVAAVKAHYNDRAKNFMESGIPYVGWHLGDDVAGTGAGDAEAWWGTGPEPGTAVAVDPDRGDAGDDDLRTSEAGGAEVPSGTDDRQGSAVVHPWPPLDRDISGPYVVSLEEFTEQDDPGWSQLTITYYAGDKVLADDKDQPIRDIHGTVGPLTLGGFGGVSQDPHIRYVRNHRLELDFEIVLNSRTYADAVLNYGDPNRRPSEPARPDRSLF